MFVMIIRIVRYESTSFLFYTNLRGVALIFLMFHHWSRFQSSRPLAGAALRITVFCWRSLVHQRRSGKHPVRLTEYYFVEVNGDRQDTLARLWRGVLCSG